MESPHTPNDTPQDGGLHGWSPSLDPQDLVGLVLAGRFEVEALIAEGGMAWVYQCIDRHLELHVALKVFRRDRPESRQRFGLEAEVLARLSHVGLVKSLDYGQAHVAVKDERSFIALELLRGESLGAQLARRRRLPWREVIELGIQVATTVQALHDAGVIHRDLKPHNLVALAGPNVRVKVIDLGLCKLTDRYTRSFDRAPARRLTDLDLGQPGTPGYMPPEAAERPADERFDVYALGVTLYQLLTGTMLQAAGFAAIEDVPEDLSRLILAALRPDPDERLASADHLRRGLEAIQELNAEVRPPDPRFAGLYDRMGVLGVGACSVTYLAYDRTIERMIALKLVRSDRRRSEDDAIRFLRAAKILGLVRHPSVPFIHHVGVADKQDFVALERCEGVSATELATPRRHLEPRAVIEVGLQLAGALATCHALGVVYCDLHTGNVLIDLQPGKEAKAWLFDFDNARLSEDFWDRLPQRWATPPEKRREPSRNKRLETTDYAAPEVKAGAPFSPASDVFALGMMLYRLLTGMRPFGPGGDKPAPVDGRCPACPEALSGVLMRMLAAEPTARPRLEQVCDLLELARDQLAEAAREARRPEKPAETPSQGTPTPDSSDMPPEPSGGARRSPWPWLLAAAVLVGFALGRLRASPAVEVAHAPRPAAVAATPVPADRTTMPQPPALPTFQEALLAARPALQRCARQAQAHIFVELAVAAGDTSIRELTLLNAGPAAECARGILGALRFQPSPAEAVSEEYSP